MEIRLDKQAVKQIRLSALDAIDEGDTETLREDIIEAFTDEQIEEIERRVETADFYDFLSEILDEWSGEDVEELLELLESQLADAGVDLKHNALDVDDEDEDEDEDEEGDEDESEEGEEDDEFPLEDDKDDSL